MDKALLVFDQVSYATLANHLAGRNLEPPTPVKLDYVPRTTPVGQATISTGLTPAQHRVQGRSWYDRYDKQYTIKSIVSRKAPRAFDKLAKNSLATKLRSSGARGIVIAAAKDFIPFLFGAWSSDVSLYPKTVAPEEFANTGPLAGRVGFEIVVDTWTRSGAASLVKAHAAIVQRFTALTSVVSGSDVGPFALPSGSVGSQTLQWAMPTSWGRTSLAAKGPWSRILPQLADAIDDFYADVSLVIAQHLDPPRALIQSCFAPDAAGHRSGPSSSEYAQSVARSIDRAQRIHAAGWSIVVVSDHGGRDTAATWVHHAVDGSVSDGVAKHWLPPARFPILNGDHLVGYGGATGPTFFGLHGGGMPALAVPNSLSARSFHPQQIPSWLVLPPIGVRFDRVARRSGGGDHGACHENGVVSDIDNEVGLWTLPAQRVNRPTSLEEVAAWFSALP